MFTTLTLLGATQAAEARHLYSCDQTNPIDRDLVQHVDFVTDAADDPRGAQVIRVSTGLPEIGPGRVTPAPNYAGGYFFTTYGLESWFLGSDGWASYVLLLPEPPHGTRFDAELHTLFGPGGADGNLQNQFTCDRVW